MVLSPEQAAEIERLRTETHQTLRPTVPALEELLFHPMPILDHGFVRVVDYMGDDGAVVQAARVSYGRGTKRVSEDKGLINYLIRHRHTTPFEMCEIKFHVKLPIFVARQWIRHRTANVNEYSARYSILDREFYLPATENLAAQSDQNRQGRGEVLGGAEAARVLDLLRDDAQRNYDHYLDMLNEGADGKPADPSRAGLTRELARMNLTLNMYTQWYWKIDLHNLMHFIALRADPHAQFEIRVYADALSHVLDRWMPITAAACREHIIGGTRISATGLKLVKRLIKGEKVTQADSGLQPREWRELATLLGVDPA